MSNADDEHSVIITFQYGLEEIDPIYDLVDKLSKILSETNIGNCDGHEIAMDNSDGSIYLYGSNAEILFKAIKPTLDSTSFLRGANATLRFGSAKNGASEIEVIIGEKG